MYKVFMKHYYGSVRTISLKGKSNVGADDKENKQVLREHVESSACTATLSSGER